MKGFLAVLWFAQAVSAVAVIFWYVSSEGLDQGAPQQAARAAVALVCLVGPYVLLRGLTAAARLAEEDRQKTERRHRAD